MAYTELKLNYLLETKERIREAIEAKGQAVADEDTFRSYAEKIAAIGGSSETVIFAEQTLGFEYSEGFGAYYAGFNTSPFSLVDGQEYIVVWDGIENKRTAFAFTNPRDGTSCVALGNPLVTGGTANEDKFAVVEDKTNDNAYFFSLETTSSHTVKIYQKASSSGGGGSLPAGIYMTPYIAGTNTQYPNRIFTLNGEIYTAGTVYYHSGDINFILKWNGSGWNTVAGSTASGASTLIGKTYNCDSIEFNGKRHFYSYGYHYAFDGSSVIQYANINSRPSDFGSYYAVFKNELYIATEGKIYKWNEADDTLTALYTYDSSSYPSGYRVMFATTEHLYMVSSGLNIYENGTFTNILSSSDPAYNSSYFSYPKVIGNNVYSLSSSKIYTFNLDTFEGKELGSISGLYQSMNWIGNENELAIMGRCHKLSSNCTAYYPSFKLHIIE